MTTTVHILDPNGLKTWLPIFEENAPDIPDGYGIEQSHDGGWYPYEINPADSQLIAHLKDVQGLDLHCVSRAEALSVIMAEVAG